MTSKAPFILKPLILCWTACEEQIKAERNFWVNVSKTDPFHYCYKANLEGGIINESSKTIL